MKKWTLIVIIILGLFAATHFINFKSPMFFGVSFNVGQARYMGLDPQTVFRVVLDDWGFKYVRLSAPWSEIEATRGVFDFAALDWYFHEAQARGVKIMLSVGQKTPRWPECHNPEWARNLSDAEYFAALRNQMAAVAEHYKNHPALEIWQVENEPFLPFGQGCRQMTKADLEKEIKLIKRLDEHHPVLVSDSGELSSWRKTARAGDLFGTTMYRVVWNKFLGYWNYDWLPPAFYRLKLWLNRVPPERAYIVELQAEPWIPNNSPLLTPLKEQYRSLNAARLQKNVNYARRLGFNRAYLWGAEWWYWLQSRGEGNEIVEYVKGLEKMNDE